MIDPLAELRASAGLLLDTARVVELAVESVDAVCDRGAAFGVLTPGPGARRAVMVRVRRGGRWLPLELPHAVHVRTPAYDLAEVPEAQRNRWLEPFREGVATPEGFRRSTIYPFVRQLGVLELGRIAVCAGPRQVALIGVALPEGSTFSDDERVRLGAVADGLVLPLRVAASLVEARGPGGPLEGLLDAAGEAIVATDARGEMVDASRPAALRIRRDPALLDRIRGAVRASTAGASVVRADGLVLRVSACAVPGSAVAWLAVIDGDGFVEPPVVLTPRQRELLGLVERGLTNAEAATAMGLAPSTVKTMLERLYRATAVSNRVELLAWVRARRPAPRGPG